MKNERETISRELKEQENANLEILRLIYEQDRRIQALERTVRVKSLAHTTAREVELRERYGRLGVPR